MMHAIRESAAIERSPHETRHSPHFAALRFNNSPYEIDKSFFVVVRFN